MNKNIIADTLLNYNKNAIIELNRGDYQKALQIFKQSYFIENEMNFAKERAKTLINIANTQMLLNKPEESLNSAKEAVAIFKKLGCNKDYIQTLLFMGRVYLFMKDIKKAKEIFQELIKKSDVDDIKGEAYYNLYDIYIENKNNYQAQDSITKAIKHFERAEKNEKLKKSLQRRAEFFKELNREDLAFMDLNRIDFIDSGMEL